MQSELPHDENMTRIHQMRPISYITSFSSFETRYTDRSHIDDEQGQHCSPICGKHTNAACVRNQHYTFIEILFYSDTLYQSLVFFSRIILHPKGSMQRSHREGPNTDMTRVVTKRLA